MNFSIKLWRKLMIKLETHFEPIFDVPTLINNVISQDSKLSVEGKLIRLS